MTRVLPHGPSGAIVVADSPLPPLADWQRAMLVELLAGPVSEECRRRIESVLAADEAAWCDR